MKLAARRRFRTSQRAGGIPKILRRARGKALRWPVTAPFVRSYYRLRLSAPVWEKVINRSARSRFAADPPMLTPAHKGLVGKLNSDGIAIAPVSTVVEESTWCAVREEAHRLLGDVNIRRQIMSGRSSGIRGKFYVIRVFGDGPRLDLTSPLVRLVLHDNVLSVVNSYLGMLSRMKSLDLWYNLPSHPEERLVSSQRWHRDYEDARLVKLFLYLNDVDSQMGPFTYMRKSHSRGPYRHVFPQRPPEGSCPLPEEVNNYFPVEHVVTCVGSAGTLILADTTGLHMGGRSTTEGRIVFTATYASMAAVDGDNYDLSTDASTQSLTPAARFALALAP